MAFLPVKTDDVVLYDGVKFVVNQVQLTSDGPILELLPLKAEPTIVHASEVKLADAGETDRRFKAVGLVERTVEAKKSLDITLPVGMTQEQAQIILRQFASNANKTQTQVTRRVAG